MTGATERILAGKHVVVTGFTGFLAKVFVAALLEHVPDIGRITLVVRPRGRMRRARVRVEQIVDTSPVFRRLRAVHGAGLSEWLGARLDAVDGDIETPGCGLPPDSPSLSTADLVVHCAGLTDFEPDPASALRTNVAGAIHAAELAERLGVPLVHVSTAYVAGARGRAVVEERIETGVAPSGVRFDPAAEIRALQLAIRTTPAASDRIAAANERARRLGWPNIYTYTKGLAEHALSHRAERNGLDLTIVRPSIVECARAFPFPGWNEGLNTAGPLAWLISTAFRRMPSVPDHRFDVVPVDDVALGLAAIGAAAIEGRAGGVFQLASSDHNPLTFERAVELTGLGMRRWTRQGNGTSLDRVLFRWLDPVSVPREAPGPLSIDRLRSASRWLRRGLGSASVDRAPEALRDPLTDAREALLDRLSRADATMERIDKMLALYLPFIHDNDWEFRTERARALTRGEPVFRFDLSDIDWCRYWVDIEYPGLRRWCIPLIEGQEIPSDPPSSPRFRLAEPAPVPSASFERVASK